MRALGANPSLFFSVFSGGNEGGQPGSATGSGRTPFPRGAEVRVRLVGCRWWEPALPKGATEGAGTPSGGGGDVSPGPVWQSRAEPGTHKAVGAGPPGPPWRGRSTPFPLATPRDAAAGNGPASPALRPYGEVRLVLVAFTAHANEIPLPSPIPGAVRPRGAPAPGPARPAPPAPLPAAGAPGGDRQDLRSDPRTVRLRHRGCPARSPRRDAALPGPSTGILRCAAAAASPRPPRQPDIRSF